MKRLHTWTAWGTVALSFLAGTAYIVWQLRTKTLGEVLVPIYEFTVNKVWTASLFDIGQFHLTLEFLFWGIVFLWLLWFFSRFASRSLKTKILDRTDLAEGLKFSVQRGVMYVTFTLGALILLPMMGLDLSSLAVFGGAVGIGIGLGLQTIAKNFAAGLILLFEQPIKVGDRVEVGDLLGDIVRIGSRGTWVRTNSNVIMIVPNSEFVEGRVTNWTANDRRVRLSIPLGVSYDCEPEQVRALLYRVARDHPAVLVEPSPAVRFTGFGDSALDFELRVWTADYVTTPRKLKSELYFALFAALKQAGIEIPFPQRDLHVRSAPPEAHLLGPTPQEASELRRALDARSSDGLPVERGR